MKPRDVQRSVRAARIDRSEGDAPNIGRVSRVPGTGMPKGERRRRRRGERGQGDRTRSNRKKVILTWSAVFSFFALMIMGAAVWYLIKSSRHRSAAMVGDVAPPIQERIVSEFESPTEDAALAIVKAALANRDPSMIAGFFHQGSADPAEIVEFVTGLEKRDGRLLKMDWLSSVDANGLLLDGVLLSFDGDDKPRSRLVLLTPDKTGKWKIDFDALARTVDPSWSEILGNRAGKALVRVIVTKDSYHNGVFKDESQWSCYAMVSPDHEEILLGYCHKNSPQDAAMLRITSDAELLMETRGLNRVTVEIQRPMGADSRQFEITRVLAEDWVMAPKAFDENFK